jgi:hypothetical protein
MSRAARCATVVVLASAILTAADSSATQADFSKTANPELLADFGKELQLTPSQAEGAAGSIFSAARAKLPAADWARVSKAVPGMDALLKAAPSGGPLGAAGGLAGAMAAFQKLGLKPDLVSKALPLVLKYVGKTGGADVASLLAGVLK